MKTTKKTVMKKPAVKKMSTGGTTKKMSYSGVKPKALKKAELGMSMDTESDVSGYPPGKKRRGSPYRSGTGGGKWGGKVGGCAKGRRGCTSAGI